MASVIQTNFRLRKTFARIREALDIPNLIDIQKQSYDQFLQADVRPEDRRNIGLQGVFKSVFPIKDYNDVCSLEFVEYEIDPPKYDVEECISRGATYEAIVKVLIRLIVWDVEDGPGGEKIRSLRDMKEERVFLGEIPLMTENGTFIINGTERVIVSQLHRSPGAFFDHDSGKNQASGKRIYSARIIPYRGAWLDFEFDAKDILHVKIDRKRKLPVTVLLRALYQTPPDPNRKSDEDTDRTGHTAEDILNLFYDQETIVLGELTQYKVLNPDLHLGTRLSVTIEDGDGKTIGRAKAEIKERMLKKLEAAKLDKIPISSEELLSKYAAEDLYDEETGEVIVESGEQMTEKALEALRACGITKFPVLFIDHNKNVGTYLRDTLAADKMRDWEEARLEIYQRLRPGDPPTPESAERIFEDLFYKAERYDLSKVGRLKINQQFGTDLPLDYTTLTSEDIINTVRGLIERKSEEAEVDDIDHLGNRRVRAVGELIENTYRTGLSRMERAVREKMGSNQEIETQMPHDLINNKPVTGALKEYFGGSALSQFMDQTNPLSEVTHKRRLSALGPGGLTRERAGFEVRDVHPTHYGRICPIETPEGPNIGLIASLATYARVNEYGFIESPFRAVEDGKPQDEIMWMDGTEEQRHNVAQASTPVDENGRFIEEVIACRSKGEPTFMPRSAISLMDVSANQLVSIAAALIPFLEHDDANRALMGSNMQRQAVPLLRTNAPLVGTGMEQSVARDSGVTVVARHDGVVESVDASRIVIKADGGENEEFAVRPDIYKLIKYQRSNQSTSINQRPIVREGERVRKGDVIADGPATDRGELALGQNAIVAFMPWNGYNFEDAILISERVVSEDIYTSIHIEEIEVEARDTKLGKEEITRDIPNVGEEALANLDESGIVRIGAEVESGDILVGKITPKGETQLSPEEKLLRAIFGEKAGDVRDSSRRMPTGERGVVIGAKVFTRKGLELDERSKKIVEEEERALLKDENDEISIIRDAAFRRVFDLLQGATLAADLIDDRKRVLLTKGDVITESLHTDVPRRFWKAIRITNGEKMEARRDEILNYLDEELQLIREKFQEKLRKLRQGDEMSAGVNKRVKVYVAVKRKLQVGDKMAGRHGNKGVISRILPVEDMPFLEDGTPVDVVLNPLGVPSRMNVGQILETHLGWAAWNLGRRVRELMEKRDFDALRPLIIEIFQNPDLEEMINSLSDDELYDVAATMKNGVHLATPVFDGANESDIKRLYNLGGVAEDGKVWLYDGRSGERFTNRVTVGVMYVLKLHHLVDEKIHARATGPYSLVTQQPLGGKAQNGGQRLGEMEVWAMEAYGAAYSLQEFLTVKSDDVSGRSRIYEAIIKGDNSHVAGLPESFNVLVKELESLCFNMDELSDEDLEAAE